MDAHSPAKAPAHRSTKSEALNQNEANDAFSESQERMNTVEYSEYF